MFVFVFVFDLNKIDDKFFTYINSMVRNIHLSLNNQSFLYPILIHLFFHFYIIKSIDNTKMNFRHFCIIVISFLSSISSYIVL